MLIATACGPGPKSQVDSGHAIDGPRIDTAPQPDDLEAPDGDLPYRHTIVLDGTDDFATADTLDTTSTPAYSARVAWDDTNVYVGYHGPDLVQTVTDAANKWLFVYIDVDPGTATGATASPVYRTQHATFPAGFGAEIHARWKANATFREVSTYDGSAWVATTIDAWGHAADFVELAIPRSQFPSAATIGLVTWMINETDLAESSYAGLYTGNFVDGPAQTLPLTKYMTIDFASPRSPNDPSNETP